MFPREFTRFYCTQFETDNASAYLKGSFLCHGGLLSLSPGCMLSLCFFVCAVFATPLCSFSSARWYLLVQVNWVVQSQILPTLKSVILPGDIHLGAGPASSEKQVEGNLSPSDMATDVHNDSFD